MKPPGAAPGGSAGLLCPLCGHPNECAMAAGASTPCWCSEAVFAAGLRERAARAGGAARCICARCASEPIAPQAREGTTPGTR